MFQNIYQKEKIKNKLIRINDKLIKKNINYNLLYFRKKR